MSQIGKKHVVNNNENHGQKGAISEVIDNRHENDNFIDNTLETSGPAHETSKSRIKILDMVYKDNIQNLKKK